MSVEDRGFTVLHVVPGYAPAQGGIETLVDSLGPHLRDTRGVSAAVLAPRRWFERPDDFMSFGMPVHSVDIPTHLSGGLAVNPIVKMFAGVRRVFNHVRPHLVHVHGLGHLTLPASRVSQSLNIPLIHHIHGNIHDDIVDTHVREIQDARTVIAVSETTAHSIRERTGRVGPIAVISNGIASPARPSHINTGTSVVMVGRLEPNKGFDHGIAALSLLRDRDNVTLEIVGVGQSLIDLQHFAQQRGVKDRVTFHGRCTREKTREIIATSRLVLIPSTSIEGFSLVAAEAALLGVPVVAYRMGGLGTTIRDGATGILVEPRNVPGLARAMERLLGDDSLHRSLSEQALAHAADAFSLSRFGDEIYELYASVLTSSERRNT